jgi:hypothetical protein
MYDSVTAHGSIREYRVEARRTASTRVSQPAHGHRWTLSMPSGGRLADSLTVPDPVELLLKAVAAAVVAGTEEAAALLELALDAIEVHVYAVLRNHAACPLTVEYDLTVESDVPEARLVQLHEELRQGSAVLKVVAAGTLLNGRMHPRRA